MSIELIRIVDSPSGSSMGTAFGGMLALHVKNPKGPTSVTVRLDWGVQAHAANPVSDRQTTIHPGGAPSPTDESKELHFNLSSSSAHTVTRPKQSYKITLMQIGSDSSGFLWYEFQVTTQD